MIRRILPLAAVFIMGCASKYTNSIHINPAAPLRVAVLPFGEVDKNGNFMKSDVKLAIDDVSLLSDELKSTPGEIVQKLVERKLGQTNFDLVSPALVAANLSHNGFLQADPRAGYDFKKIFEADKAQMCDLMACDALLFGKVTKWDRTYLAIQSVSEVGVDLKLISKEGETLVELQGMDSRGRGLSGGPTGFSDLVIEPIKGLSNDVITSLADDVVEKMLSPLYVANRPEFLNSEPPSIFASAHDAPTGKIDHSKYLTVVVYGSPAKNAYFSIGDKIVNIPMIERDAGHYIGEYYPLSADSFGKLPVYVYLSDANGKTTRQEVGTGDVTLN